jgi:hypothetical protein
MKCLVYGRCDSIPDFVISFPQNYVQNVSCPLDIGYVSYEKSGWRLLLAVLALSLKLRDVSPTNLNSVKNGSDCMIYSPPMSRVSPSKYKSEVSEAATVSVVRE